MNIEQALLRAYNQRDDLLYDQTVKQVMKRITDLEQKLLTAAGDDLCRLSQEEIKALNLKAVPIPPKEEFLASCERFHTQVASEAGVNHNCLTLAQLVAENEKLRKQNEDFIQRLSAKAHEYVEPVLPLITRLKELNYQLASKMGCLEPDEYGHPACNPPCIACQGIAAHEATDTSLQDKPEAQQSVIEEKA